jgi:hypothetical protein
MLWLFFTLSKVGVGRCVDVFDRAIATWGRWRTVRVASAPCRATLQLLNTGNTLKLSNLNRGTFSLLFVRAYYYSRYFYTQHLVFSEAAHNLLKAHLHTHKKKTWKLTSKCVYPRHLFGKRASLPPPNARTRLLPPTLLVLQSHPCYLSSTYDQKTDQATQNIKSNRLSTNSEKTLISNLLTRF